MMNEGYGVAVVLMMASVTGMVMLMRVVDAARLVHLAVIMHVVQL